MGATGIEAPGHAAAPLAALELANGSFIPPSSKRLSLVLAPGGNGLLQSAEGDLMGSMELLR